MILSSATIRHRLFVLLQLVLPSALQVQRCSAYSRVKVFAEDRRYWSHWRQRVCPFAFSAPGGGRVIVLGLAPAVRIRTALSGISTWRPIFARHRNSRSETQLISKNDEAHDANPGVLTCSIFPAMCSAESHRTDSLSITPVLFCVTRSDERLSLPNFSCQSEQVSLVHPT